MPVNDKLNAKGLPSSRKKLPGQDWEDGAPGYVKNAASEAARLKDFNHDAHRVRGRMAGAPHYAKDKRLAKAGD